MIAVPKCRNIYHKIAMFSWTHRKNSIFGIGLNFLPKFMQISLHCIACVFIHLKCYSKEIRHIHMHDASTWWFPFCFIRNLGYNSYRINVSMLLNLSIISVARFHSVLCDCVCVYVCFNFFFHFTFTLIQFNVYNLKQLWVCVANIFISFKIVFGCGSFHLLCVLMKLDSRKLPCVTGHWNGFFPCRLRLWICRRLIWFARTSFWLWAATLLCLRS